MDQPELVTLHVWRVPPRRVPAALVRVARDPRAVRATPGVRFAKLLGTGAGRTFGLREADPCRWALLTAWHDAGAAARFEDGAVVGRWAAMATESCRITLRPLRSTGRWSRRAPFGDPVPPAWSGPVAAITHSRLALRRAVAFWRAVPPVAAQLRDQPGVCLAMGIAEAPLGVQGTFSVWDDERSLRGFAYSGRHAAAIRRTPVERWYAEELFARFAVLAADGSVDGRTVLA